MMSRITLLSTLPALAFVLPLALYGQANHATPYEFATLAGLAKTKGYADGSGASARFDAPNGVAVDSAGNIYVADSNNRMIRKITADGTVSTFAGAKDSTGPSLLDGTGTDARFSSPRGLAVDGDGNLFVADYWNHSIRKITPAGVVTTLAGDYLNFGSRDGTGKAARFFYPIAVALDSTGNVLVVDEGNRLIRKVTPQGVVTTIAGSAGQGGSADGLGSAARFYYPGGIAVDSLDNIFVADSLNHTIRKITPAGMVSTFAGKAETQGGVDGIGGIARFNRPVGLTVDADDNLYVTDSFGQIIRKVTSNGTVSTLAGKYADGDASDGIGKNAGFFNPTGVSVDENGTLFVVESVNHTVRFGIPAEGDSAPVANGKSVILNEDKPAAIVLTGFDPESSPLTFRIVSPPLKGTLTGTPPALSYKPAANFNGADSFTFQVNDGVQNSTAAKVNLTITAVNDPPVARRGVVRTPKNKAVKITLAATDVEKNPLKYRIVKSPTKGKLTGTPPKLTYTPKKNTTGTDNFTFKANDGKADSVAAIVRITITP